MFVGNEQRFHFFHREIQLFHPAFRFPATQPSIDQYRFRIVADIVAIGIAAGVEGGGVEGHTTKVRRA